jgi:hypothetical protein
MNRNRWLAHSSLFLFAVLMCCAAFAQDSPRTGTADIPFDFYIAGNKLPAGQYTLNIIAPTYVLLRSKDGKTQQDLYFLQTASPEKNQPSKVVFALRGGKYYFAGVWSYLGKAQLTSFTTRPGDQSKDVPLIAGEKTVAKP